MRSYYPLLFILLLLMTACQPQHMHLGDPEEPYPTAREPQIGDILHLPTGVFVAAEDLYEQAARAQVIYIGETHDNPAAHRFQLQVLEALNQRNPGQVSLGMEMFTPAQQPSLDRWSAGKLSEKEFLKEVDWYNNWQMDFGYYRDLLLYCRDNRLPVLGLNASKTLQKKVGRTPFNELTQEEQDQLPEMDHSDPYQRAMVEAVFSDHKMGQSMIDGFQRVQTLWDESMAQNLADYLKTADKSHQVVVIAGGNHVRYGYGIPRRVFRRIPTSYLLLGSTEIKVAEDKEVVTMNVTKPDYPMPPYHFVTFTEYENLPSTGVKLGVMLENTEDGLLIKGVVPESTAAAVGLQEEDLLVQLDNIRLHEAFDLIYELKQKAPGDKADLTFIRGDQETTVEVIFQENSMSKHGMKR